MGTSKIIRVEKDEETGDGYIDMKHFADIFDIEQIVYYEIIPLEGQSLELRFFDKDRKQVTPNDARTDDNTNR